MDFKPLTIIQKQVTTPLEFSQVTNRIGHPTLVTPVFIADVSMLRGIFVPSASLGPDFVWDINNYLDVSIEGVTRFDKLKDVSIVQPANRQFPTYDASIEKWKNINSIRLEDYMVDIEDLFYTKSVIDSSFATKLDILHLDNIKADTSTMLAYLTLQDISIHNMDVSLNWLYGNVVLLSYLNYFVLKTDLDASLGKFATNASINSASFAKNASLGLYATNASTNLALSTINASISNKWDKTNNFFRESSIGTGLFFNNSTHQLDVSIATSYSTTYIDGSLNNKIDKNTPCDTSTSTQMRFDKTVGYVYGSISSPLTGAITMSASSALVGVVSLAIHKDNSTGVAVPSTFKLLSGVYDGSVNNFLYVQYLDPSNQVYTIGKIQ